MKDLIPIGIIALVVGFAIYYVVKAKKSGRKCIGCPSGCSCPESKGAGCSCGGSCSGGDTCSCHDH